MSTAKELSCTNCGVAYGSDDIFCENCGYDFITGSLPGPSEQYGGPEVPSASQVPLDAPPPILADPPTPPAPAVPDLAGAPLSAPAPAGAPSTAETPVTAGTTPVSGMVLIDVSIDRGYFDAVVSEGELTFPESHFVTQRLELAGPEIHIGRTSQGRAIHPDIDVAALTGDPAVSSRHAVIRLDPAGTMSVTDVGSTNGTYLDAFDGSPVSPGMASLLMPGGVIYVGAWTSLTVTLAP